MAKRPLSLFWVLAPVLLGLLGLAWVLGWTRRQGTPDEPYQPLSAETGKLGRTVPASLVGEPMAGARRVRFKVEGPCCNGCCVKLYDAALALPGVQAAALRYDELLDLVVGEAFVEETVAGDLLEQTLTFDKYRGSLLDEL